MQAFVMPAPIPLYAPINANTWHPIVPVAKPLIALLYIKIGALAIIIKSRIANCKISRLLDVRRLLVLKQNRQK